MSRRLIEPASPPALVRALGSVPFELRVAGQLVPTDEHSSVSIRRKRGVREPLGDPASCSVAVNVATPPTWRKGDRVTVQLSDAALAAVFGPEFLASNYAPNPGFEVDTTGWAAVGSNVTLTRTTATHRYGVAAGRVVYSAAKSSGLEVLKLAGIAQGVAAPGDRWTARVSLNETGTGGADLYRLELVAVSAANADLGTVARADVLVASNVYTDYTVPSIAVCPAGTVALRFRVITQDEYVSGNGFDLDALTVHASATPPTEYVDGSLAGFTDGLGRPISYRWDGAAHGSVSRKFVTGTPEAVAEARYRFVGRLSDLKLRTGRSAPATAQLVAVGTTATAARVNVGDTPWSAETCTTRAARILGLVAAADPTITVRTITSATGPNAAPRDVDSQPAAALLEGLAPMIDPRAGLVEKRDGGLVFGYISSTEFGPLDLPARAVAQGLDHDVAPRVNTVTVDLGEPPPGTVLLANEVTNPSFEVDVAGWTTLSGTFARDTVNLMGQGVASGKFTPTAASNNPNVYTTFPVTPGQVFRARMLLRSTVAGGAVMYRLQLSSYTAAGGTGTNLGDNFGTMGSAGVAVPQNIDTELDVTFDPIPAGAVSARLYMVRVATAVPATAIFNIDRVSAMDVTPNTTSPAAATSPYFDGATPAGQYDYAWTGTAHASRSVAKANTTTGAALVRLTDAASVAAYGPYTSKVDAPVSWAVPSVAWAYGRSRATAELLSGGWQYPPASVDVLALLDGRIPSVGATPSASTPLELVKRLLRAELGSPRTIYWPGGVTPAHVPPIHAQVGALTVLDETITPHRWVITTESERLT